MPRGDRRERDPSGRSAAIELSRPKRALIVAGLILAASLPYLRTLGHELVWDDLYIVSDIDEAARRGGVVGVWTAPFLAGQNAAAVYYRPIVHLSFLLDARAGGGTSWPYHATNIVLHAAATLLVFALIAILLGGRWAAVGGAALFAVLPVHVESVAFAAGRTDLWATILTLAALIGWLLARSSPRGSRRVPLLWMFAVGAYLAGCLAKEVVFLLPVVVGAWSLLLPDGAGPTRSAVFRRAAIDAARFLPGLVGALGLRTWAMGTSMGGPDPSPLLTAAPALAAKAFLAMSRMLVAPWPHNALYTREYVTLGGVTVLAGFAAIALHLLPLRVRGLSVGWLAGAFGFLFVVPALGVPSNTTVMVAERYLYLPSVGLCLVIGAYFSLAAARSPRLATVVGIATLVGLGLACHVRSAVWRNESTLAEDIVRTAPNAAFAWDILGRARLEQERYDEALTAFDRAVQLDPGDSAYHNGAGIALRRLDRPDLAAIAFRKSLAIDPGSVGTRLNLAYACISLRDLNCIQEQRRVLTELDPEALQDLEAVLAGGRQRRGR